MVNRDIKAERDYAIERLNALRDSDDTEEAHREADAILCELLSSLGCDDVVRAWDAIEKLYA